MLRDAYYEIESMDDVAIKIHVKKKI